MERHRHRRSRRLVSLLRLQVEPTDGQISLHFALAGGRLIEPPDKQLLRLAVFAGAPIMIIIMINSRAQAKQTYLRAKSA